MKFSTLLYAATVSLVFLMVSPLAFAGGDQEKCLQTQESPLAIAICKKMAPAEPAGLGSGLASDEAARASLRDRLMGLNDAVREDRPRGWADSVGPELVWVNGSGYAYGDFYTRYTLVSLVHF